MGSNNVFGTGPVVLNDGSGLSAFATNRIFTNALFITGNVNLGETNSSAAFNFTNTTGWWIWAAECVS